MTIIKRLQPYYEVLHTRRGRYAFKRSICNGLRHYPVRIFAPVPSYLRFGTFSWQLRHDGQQPTCRRCNQPGHFAFECANKLCFTGEQVGHEAPQCPSRVRCNICKEVGHLAKLCMFSWSRAETVRPSVTDEARAVDLEGVVSPPIKWKPRLVLKLSLRPLLPPLSVPHLMKLSRKNNRLRHRTRSFWTLRANCCLRVPLLI